MCNQLVVFWFIKFLRDLQWKRTTPFLIRLHEKLHLTVGSCASIMTFQCEMKNLRFDMVWWKGWSKVPQVLNFVFISILFCTVKVGMTWSNDGSPNIYAQNICIHQYLLVRVKRLLPQENKPYYNTSPM